MTSHALQANRIVLHLVLALGGSLLILGGMYYAASHAGHDIDPAQLIDAIKTSSPKLFLAYVVISLLGIVFRAWRYRVLLQASGESSIPGFRDMTLITAVRNMTVDLLPARLGELVFVVLLKSRAGTQVSAGLSALLFSTLLDIVILAPITIAIGLMVGFPSKQPYLLALIALVAALGFIVGLKFVLPLLHGWFERWAQHRNRVVSKLFDFVLSITDAVEATMKARVFGSVISLTLLIRLLKYIGLLCLFYGLAQGNFPEMAEMSSLKVLGAMMASEMTASMPVPALMSFGTWELGGMTLLAFFGAIPQAALLTLLGVHIQTQALDYGIGIAAFLALFLLNGGRVGQTLSGRRRNTLLAAVFAVAAAALAWVAYDKAPDSQSLSEATAISITRPAGSPLPAWVASLDGFIVWSSNRSGNHDIWLMNLPDMHIRPLTTHPHTENFGRISPDGRKVVFARSHKEWQSLRDETPWDIWMLEIGSGKEKLIARWGMSPSWSPDGTFIIFKRDGGQTMAYDLVSGKERVYYESGRDVFMKTRVNMETPSIGEGKRMAFTYRSRGQPTNVIRDKNGKFTVVHRDSCQVLWAPSGDYVTYVQKGGRQINRIMRYDPETGKKTQLLDLPGDFSHEYFARLSADERFMVLAASSGDHEHDLANYELFLWEVGSDPAGAERLTFNTNNDSWPDIWLHKK